MNKRILLLIVGLTAFLLALVATLLLTASTPLPSSPTVWHVRA